MSVTEYEVEINGQLVSINKEMSTAPDDPYKFYIPNGSGQGCSTVWFNGLVSAKRAWAAQIDGVITGRDLADCNLCACRQPGQGFKPFICGQAKQEYAGSFESKKGAWQS